MDSLVRTLISPEDMAVEAERFIDALLPETNSATLVALSGDLGAGKTTFTQYIAKTLGVGEVVNSPTFVIEKVYGIPEGKRFQRLIHIDAYRLSDSHELTSLGFGEVMSHPSNLVIVEWPENVTGILEQASVKILLEVLPDGSRQITYA